MAAGVHACGSSSSSAPCMCNELERYHNAWCARAGRTLALVKMGFRQLQQMHLHSVGSQACIDKLVNGAVMHGGSQLMCKRLTANSEE